MVEILARCTFLEVEKELKCGTSSNSIAWEVTIMSKPDEPREGASSREEAELRVLRRIRSALERDHIDELAAALLEQSDPA
jgi:hypothetical protein